MYREKIKCCLCGIEAITTWAHYPLCEFHHDEVQKEARLYLLISERAIYQKVRSADTYRLSTGKYPLKEGQSAKCTN